MGEIELTGGPGDVPLFANVGPREDGRRFTLTLGTSTDPVSLTMSRTQLRALVTHIVEATVPDRGDDDPTLTEEEFGELLLYLRRYANTELDQFEHWSLTTKFGRVYVDMHRAAGDPTWYVDLDPYLVPGQDPGQ